MARQLSKILGVRFRLLPGSKRIDALSKNITLERGIGAGSALCLLGIAGFAGALIFWGEKSFGTLVPDLTRLTIPALTLVIVGLQTIFSSFFLAFFGFQSND